MRSTRHRRLRRRAAIALLLTLAPACARADIIFATEGTYPPWSETGGDNQLAGFDVDLVHALCRQLCVTCRIEKAAFPGMMDELVAGAFDAIISGIAITDEREKRIAFSRPYMSLSVSFAVARRSPLAKEAPASVATTLRLLATARLAAQDDTVNARLIATVLPNATLVTFSDQPSLDAAVAAGAVDAGLAATEAWNTRAPVSRNAVATLGPPLTSTEYPVLGRGLAIGLRKNEGALKESLDAAICTLTADGTITTLSAKWFGRDLSVPCR